jgi:segregation and condensation protein B
VRGVDSGSAIRVLLERSLIKMLGRKDEPGRPLLYGTSSHFLEFFGMRSLKDLPTLREFTELSDENRALFKRKTGESVEDAEAQLLAADEAARAGDEQLEHISDEDLAELAAEAETDMPPPPDMRASEPAPEPEPDSEPEPEADADFTNETIDNGDTP